MPFGNGESGSKILKLSLPLLPNKLQLRNRDDPAPFTRSVYICLHCAWNRWSPAVLNAVGPQSSVLFSARNIDISKHWLPPYVASCQHVHFPI